MGIYVAGVLRQVDCKSAGFVDIQVVDAYKYSINFYKPAQVGNQAGGLFSLSGSPFRIITIENPDASPTENSKIHINNTMTSLVGSSHEEVNFVWNEQENIWTLEAQNGQRRESLQITEDDRTFKTELRTFYDSLGNVLTKDETRYQTFPWKEEIIFTATDIDGRNQTVTKTYYTNTADGANYGQLKQLVKSSGYWERYEYDSLERITQTVTQSKPQYEHIY